MLIVIFQIEKMFFRNRNIFELSTKHPDFVRVVEISDDFENVADDDNPIDNKANKVTQSNQISFVLHDELPHEQSDSRCIQ